ncbi:hypothetical protein O6R08_00370 [Cutibacterium equinum]|uniref:Lipoprotein n=1 Tax=Cutibacterium equinum TaxID=3016342 RepID=A0ABY7QYF4_9ACTN|nr:hypothetical protein [Cutibacterium equinum]WCC80061.1 hypothetical protein O6R08_00370 [Cutibacterium equinum]
MSEKNAPTVDGNTKKGCLALIVIAVILVGIIGSCGGHDDKAIKADSTTSQTTQATTPKPSPTTPTASPSQSAAQIAPKVKASVLENLMVKSFQDTCGTEIAWACAIADMTDGSKGVVEVHVQEKLSRDEAKTIAHHVMLMSCATVPDVEWVAVLDTSGGTRAQIQRSALKPTCTA